MTAEWKVPKAFILPPLETPYRRQLRGQKSNVPSPSARLAGTATAKTDGSGNFSCGAYFPLTHGSTQPIPFRRNYSIGLKIGFDFQKVRWVDLKKIERPLCF